jgi:outer membrane protein OmpA-like peptidoglycan-associated protein
MIVTRIALLGRSSSVKFQNLIGLVALALFAACAQQPPLGGPGDVTVVVMPSQTDGHVGAVVVRPLDGGEPVLLNKAYVAASVDPSRQVRTAAVESRRVKQEFSAPLASLPRSPVQFLVYFIEGTDELNPDARRTLDRVFSEFSARPSPEISVTGHTDFLGSHEYNDALSLQRAKRVRDLLVKRGIPRGAIEVAGRGKREPLHPAPANVAEPRNRRVEISVR